jgi:hypothetical protein
MAAEAGIVDETTSSQIISPWFPSLPASYCGGTFALTVEGTPKGNANGDKITPSDKDDSDDEDKKSYSNRRLALQLNSDNSQIFTNDDAISGQIFRGQKYIEQNKANDFDLRSVFNDCQIITFNQNGGVPITPFLTATAVNGINNYNPDGSYYPAATTGYPSTYQTTSSGGCSPSYPDNCIPDPPPQVSCEQVRDTNIRVLPPDLQRLDQDGNGIGCEG